MPSSSPTPRHPGRFLARTLGGARPRGLDPAAGVVVTDVGPADAPVVVLVHGIGMSERSFRPLTAALATDRRVLVPDLPGFGRSARPARVPRIEDLADVVLAVLRHRGVERAVLVGHSMGAQVVAEAMRRAPDVVERVVLIGAVVDPGAPSVARQALRLARDGLHEPLGVNAVVVSDYLRTGPSWYSSVLPHMFAYDTAAAVARLAGPVLVVRGENDPVSSRAWNRRLAALAPDGSVREVPRAGHVAMANHAPLVARWVRDGVRGGAPEGVRDEMPEGVRDEVPESVQGGVPERVRDGVPDGVRGGVPESVQDQVPEGVRGGAPEGMRDGAPEHVRGGVPDGAPAAEPDGVPDGAR